MQVAAAGMVVGAWEVESVGEEVGEALVMQAVAWAWEEALAKVEVA
jgi:hypothetical protein